MWIEFTITATQAGSQARNEPTDRTVVWMNLSQVSGIAFTNNEVRLIDDGLALISNVPNEILLIRQYLQANRLK
jgi:hypothetical protein